MISDRHDEPFEAPGHGELLWRRHDETINMWIELSAGSEVIWRGMIRTLAGALLAHNSEKRNGREVAYRQLLVAVLRSSRAETSDIAEILDVDKRMVQRDDRVLRDLAEKRRQSVELRQAC